MGETRDKMLEELKKMIRDQRARINPDILAQAENAVKKAQERISERASKAPAPEEATVPYDRESAVRAVALFLKDHADGKGFQEKLLKLLGKSLH